MPQLRKYTAQQTLQGDRTGTPSVNLRSYTGAALQQLGGQVQDAASAFQQQNQKKENFKAEADYRAMQTRVEEGMQTAAQEMPADGEGFHDGFMQNVFLPERNKFLEGLPPRLRERYGVLLADDGPDTERWSVQAATQQRDQLYNWYDSNLAQSRETLATAISTNPDAYESLLEQGMAEIDASGLPTAQKREHRQQWERMAQIAHLNRTLETNPEAVLRDLGADPRYLSPTTQFGALKEALIQQESGGQADAVSPKGAIGLMQVMPGTAIEIAKEMDDPNFNPDWNAIQITEYLSNPTTNQRYGDFYLKKMIRRFSSRGGLEAALVAYNGGPGRAEEWIESGFDDSVLPAETRKYYKSIMSRLPTRPGSKSGVKGDPADVRLVFRDAEGSGDASAGEDQVNPDLAQRVRSTFAGLGIDRVRINSGYRSAEKNEQVGGAKHSQHLRGNAVDIDVSGYSRAERVSIIRSLSANGITGLGIGSNIIHADLGGRRAWGYATSAGGGEVPNWASEAIDEHLSETARAPTMALGVSGRYGSLPYADRQKFIAQADQAVTKRFNAQNKETAVQRVKLRSAMDNEIATLRSTGQSTGGVDDTAVATVLGEDDYVEWMQRKEVAQRIFNAVDGIAQMTPVEMEERLQDYTPQPGSPTFADDQRVQSAVEAEIRDVTSERSRRPDKAALRYDDVAAAWSEIEQSQEPSPQEVQSFVRLMLDRQREFSLKPGSEAPVPREWAMQIGQSLSRIPELSADNREDVNAMILTQYSALEEVFGDYTDEVIQHSLAEYRGVGPNTADLISSYMEAIQNGGDPLGRVRERLDSAIDRDQVESVSEPGFFERAYNFFAGEEVITGGGNEAPAGRGAATEQGLNEETVRRAISAMDRLGDLDASDEAALINRYGRDVVSAAKARSGRN